MLIKRKPMSKTTAAMTMAVLTSFALVSCGEDTSTDGETQVTEGSGDEAPTTEPSGNSFESVLDEVANPEAMLADGVNIPADAKMYKTSGIGPSALNDDAEEGDPMSYVDSALLVDGELPDGMSVTEAQGLNVLRKIRELLQAQGLDVQNVATMRVFLQGENGEEPDVDGWNRAYRQYFANTDLQTGEPMQLAVGTSEEKSNPLVVNPTRPTRFALGVAFLPVEGWLVEVEVDAFYPKEE